MNVAALPVTRRLVLSDGAVEALKWLAMATMVVDHVNAVFYARELGTWAVVLGRVAFPLFAFVLAYNLARLGADLRRSLGKLLGFGLLSQVPFMLAFGYTLLPLNVLFTFAVAVAVAVCLDDGRELSALALFVLASPFVEYAWAGVALVVAALYLSRWGVRRSWIPLAMMLAVLCWWNGNGWALLAVPVLVSARYWTISLPRSPRLFWWFYPLHLAAFAVCAVLVL